jgi:hypothetical protein
VLPHFGSHGLQRGWHFGWHVSLHFGSHGGGHGGGQELQQSFEQQLPPRSTVCVCPRLFDCVLPCVALFVDAAFTLLPLFWCTSPPLKALPFQPLVTTGADSARWVASFDAVLH